MPEFQMITHGAAKVAWSDLDEFTQGYLEALFFTETAPQVEREEFAGHEHQNAMERGTADGTIPCDAGFADLDGKSLAVAIRDCSQFSAANADLLDAANQSDHDNAACGRDFWYSRNGHGVGYFDRGLGDIGDKLQGAASAYGERYVSWDAHTEQVQIN